MLDNRMRNLLGNSRAAERLRERGQRALRVCLRPADWATGVILGMIVSAAVLHARRYAGPVIDDAFITFRHALNWVHGEGFSCNPGERIEGTSSPLFAVLMAVPILFGAEPLRAATALGTVCYAACPLVAYFTTRACLRDRASRLLGLGAAAMVAASPHLAFHSQTGMETLPYCLIVALALFLHVRRDSQRSPRAWAFASGVAALTRPEGCALFAMLWAASLIGRGRTPDAARAARREVAAFAWVYVPWLLFRFVYYGAFAANSVLAKSGTLAGYLAMPFGTAAREISNGAAGAAILGYAKTHGLALALVTGCLLLRRTAQIAVLCATWVCLHVALFLGNGGDWMPHYRLLTPCMAPLAVATALGMRGFLFHREQRTKLGHCPSYLVSIALLALILRQTLQPLPEAAIALTDPIKIREVGRRLANVTRPDDVLASELAGLLPYYWGVRTIDMFGLCDAHIARYGTPQASGTGRTEPEYVASKKPTFYAFGHATNAAEFYRGPAFAPYRDDYYFVQYPYRYLASYSAGAPPVLFVRKDRSNVNQVADALGVQLVDAGSELRRIGLIR